jgi:hypothetical protein
LRPTARSIVKKYLDFVKLRKYKEMEPWDIIKEDKTFQLLHPLFERIFCTPATSAPVERVFSQSGLLMRPHRAKMGDKLLSDLVFLKCNGKIH